MVPGVDRVWAPCCSLRSLLIYCVFSVIAPGIVSDIGVTRKWVTLVQEDLRVMWHRVSICSRLPDPATDPQAWSTFIIEEPRAWAQGLACVHFTQSRLDATRPVEGVALGSVPCDVCGAMFADQRSMQSHRRSKHKIRAPQRFYADSDGMCCVCLINFQSRLRLIAHLSDTRRDKCWQRICSSRDFPKLPDHKVDELDEIDRVARRNAQRQGRSHVKAVGSAITAEGRLIGHVTC